MPLEFYLTPNIITPDPNDYMAVTLSGQTYTLEDVYDQMTHEGSTITKAEALASFEEMVKGIIRLVSSGNSIVTPLVNIKAQVVGVFNSADDSFNSSRHHIKIRVIPGIRLKEAESKITPKKIQATERLPILLNYFDTGSDTQNDIATAQGGGRITGSLLKFDEAEATQGIFYVNSSTAAETKVTAKLLRNKPGELIFINPPLVAGTYRLEVRTAFANTAGIKKGSLSDTLTVT